VSKILESASKFSAADLNNGVARVGNEGSNSARTVPARDVLRAGFTMVIYDITDPVLSFSGRSRASVFGSSHLGYGSGLYHSLETDFSYSAFIPAS
jgi:hypothetical protein